MFKFICIIAAIIIIAIPILIIGSHNKRKVAYLENLAKKGQKKFEEAMK